MRVKYSFSSRRTGNIENIRKQREKFPRLLINMIRVCDVILEVLDARFINETRNIGLEESIKSKGKKLIYVLNKADLVDIEEKKKEAKELGIYPYVFVSCKTRKGSRELRERIKIEVQRLESDYGRAQVGVMGYPNSGKSSLINFLTGRSAAGTASAAGFTKGIQKIRLSSGILILDTPGVIPDKDYTSKREAYAKHAKIGARSFDKVRDPDFAVLSLVEEYPEQLKKYYKVDFENSEDFIEKVGKKKGFLIKGGVIDTDRTARYILKEWQEGKVRA